MDRESIIEVASLLGRLFPHHHLAICDHAAMTLHGHDNLRPNYVSILCEMDEGEALLSSAKARGLRRCHLYPRAFYLMTCQDGVVIARCVRVLTCRRFRDLEFDRLLGPFCAPVLSLACVAERVARDYRRCLDKRCHDAAVRRGADLIWLMANITTHQSPDSPPGEFLASFTARFPETIRLLRRAGFEVDDDAAHDGGQTPRKRRSKDGIVIPPSSYTRRRNTATLLRRTMTFVHAATRLRLQGERASSRAYPSSAVAMLWPAPLRLRPRPASCYGSMPPPEIPPRSRARLSLARSEEPGVRASQKSMELVIGKDIILCRDWPSEDTLSGGQRTA
ncbi:hypothetical protein CP532_1439 [Ophiocordyceps camponoti-leonardi (nom. inval.)]|nr:hypothetical protein CP532_1439 [Ophiocordyceps camponoti-leonardi (nom. inval.)]